MEYQEITVDQRRQIIKGRLAGWEADHFGHTLNLAALNANGVTEGPDVDNTEKALATLAATIEVGREELAALDTAE